MSGTFVPSPGWLLHSALAGGLVLLLACAGTQLTRQPARRQRLGEWGAAAALLAAVLCAGPPWLYLSLPVSAPAAADPVNAVSSLPLLPLPVEAEAFPVEVPLEWLALGGWEPEPIPSPAEPPACSSSAATPTPLDAGGLNLSHDGLTTGLGIGYAVCALMLLGRWLLGHLALWRLLHTAQPAPESVAVLFADMTADMPRRPRLLVSRRLRVPVSCGLLQPTVVLPAGFDAGASPAALRCVFAHELTHLRRRDSWACVLFGLAQAVYFYLPWFWWLRRQVRLCQEYIADAAAVAEAPQAEDYAQFLLSLTAAPAAPVAATGVLGNSSDLFRRITMMLRSPVGMERHCPRRWTWLAAGSLLALAICVSGFGLRAEAPPADRETVALVPATAPEPPKPPPAKEPPRDDDRAPNPAPPPPPPPPPLPGPGVLPAELEDLIRSLRELPGGDPKQIQERVMKAVEQLQRQLQARGLPADAAEAARQRALEALARLGERQGIRIGRVGDGRLGVRVERPTPAMIDQLDLPAGEGQVITEVRPDSPAAKAGFKVNDILLQFAGKPVSSDLEKFIKVVEEVKPDEAVDAVVLRRGKKETIKGVKLPEAKAPRPDPAGWQFPGFPPGGFPLPPNVVWPLAPGRGGVMTTVLRTNDRFTTRYQEGNLTITLTGNVADGKIQLGEVHVQDGASGNKYDGIDKVPERYRDKVKSLLEMTEKGNIRIESKKSE
jgi:beta-lactamase regulating signal transducer with metallopeptidase domain